MDKKFYRCDLCTNLVMVLEDGGVTPHCCNKPMEELKANVKDAAVEKHVPAFTHDKHRLTVQVGDVPHPMEDAHYIQWIMVVQGEKTHIAHLKPGEEPKACFCIDTEDGPFELYEYCNLHGLWKK